MHFPLEVLFKFLQFKRTVYRVEFRSVRLLVPEMYDCCLAVRAPDLIGFTSVSGLVTPNQVCPAPGCRVL